MITEKTILQVQAAKNGLEIQIINMLSDFEKENGVIVKEIIVSRMETSFKYDISSGISLIQIIAEV